MRLKDFLCAKPHCERPPEDLRTAPGPVLQISSATRGRFQLIPTAIIPLIQLQSAALSSSWF
jgi:hypothetical protein